MEIEKKVVEDRNNNKSKVTELKVYTQPEIIKLGAMQRITLGGTPGLNDSGNEFSQNLPT